MRKMMGIWGNVWAEEEDVEWLTVLGVLRVHVVSVVGPGDTVMTVPVC